MNVFILSLASDASVVADRFASSATSLATSPILDTASPAFTLRSLCDDEVDDEVEDSCRVSAVAISCILCLQVNLVINLLSP